MSRLQGTTNYLVPRNVIEDSVLITGCMGICIVCWRNSYYFTSSLTWSTNGM